MTASQELAESAKSIIDAQANPLDGYALSLLPRDLLGLAGLLAYAQAVVGGEQAEAKIDVYGGIHVEYERFEIGDDDDKWLVADLSGETWGADTFVEAYRIAVEKARA